MRHMREYVYIDLPEHEHAQSCVVRCPSQDYDYTVSMYGRVLPLLRYRFKGTDHLFIQLPASGGYIAPVLINKVFRNREHSSDPVLLFDTGAQPVYLTGVSGTYYTTDSAFVLEDGTAVLNYAHVLPVHIMIFTTELGYSASYTLYDTDSNLKKWVVEVSGSSITINGDSYPIAAFDEIDFGYDSQQLVVELYNQAEKVGSITHDTPLDESADISDTLIKIYSTQLHIEAVEVHKAPPKQATIVGRRHVYTEELIFGTGFGLQAESNHELAARIYEYQQKELPFLRMVGSATQPGRNELMTSIGEHQTVSNMADLEIYKNVVADNGAQIVTYTVHSDDFGVECKITSIIDLQNNEMKLSVWGSELWLSAIKLAVYEKVEKQLLSLRSVMDFNQLADKNKFEIKLAIDDSFKLDDLILQALHSLYHEVHVFVVESSASVDIDDASVNLWVFTRG